ncbi:MAG: hypothetical protein KBT29_00220 [Prevotellaceae bacterium]|nr:hypothetical protein [Candidatus Minthosoma caballi]
MATLAIQQQTSPLDALMAHFASSSKSVQRAFTKYIIEANAEEVEVRRQQMMMKESLKQAFKELEEGNARPVEELLNEL